MWAIAYILLLSRIKSSWDNTPPFHDTVNTLLGSTPKVSVIVAARNEATDIAACLQSIVCNDYRNAQGKPLYEIIVIDDHSTDTTAEIVATIAIANEPHCSIKIYSLPNGQTGKKAALTYAVAKASHPILLCTDADCTVSSTWIVDRVRSLEASEASAQSGLVYMKDDETLLTRFQMMDYLATMAITNHGYYTQQFQLANGANLSYYKAAFEEVRGYEGNEHIASGDDVFLVYKIAKSHRVTFAKNLSSVVYTQPEQTWSALWQQRKRWATKATIANNLHLNTIQIFVFMYCVIILLAILLGLALYPTLFFAGMMALSIKVGMDYLFLSSLARDFRSEKIMKSFAKSFIIYFFHILSSGWFAVVKGKYQWKERSTK